MTQPPGNGNQEPPQEPSPTPFKDEGKSPREDADDVLFGGDVDGDRPNG